jgi:hypothetical protein
MVDFSDGVRGSVANMSWTWYVRIGRELVGTVIAPTHSEAQAIAESQYTGFDFEPITVQRKSLKRKK